MNIYPNPSSGTFNYSATETSTIIVYDLNGKIVAEYHNINGSFTFGDKLSQGCYVVNIISEKSRNNFRIIKTE
jgi:hypothetical protein